MNSTQQPIVASGKEEGEGRRGKLERGGGGQYIASRHTKGRHFVNGTRTRGSSEQCRGKKGTLGEGGGTEDRAARTYR